MLHWFKAKPLVSVTASLYLIQSMAILIILSLRVLQFFRARWILAARWINVCGFQSFCNPVRSNIKIH